MPKIWEKQVATMNGYGECLTPKAKVEYQYVPHNNQYNYVCNFQARFPLLRVRIKVKKPKY